MTGRFAEDATLAGLIVRAEARRLSRSVAATLRSAGAFRRSTPDRLLIAPQDVRTADPTVADDIYAGHLAFEGSFVNAHGQSPFDIVAPNEAWAEALHGFGWLRHLRAANTSLSRANARALVEDWIAHDEHAARSTAWKPAVVARRVLSWLSQAPMVLAPPDAVFYRRYMKSIGRQAAFLHRSLSGGLTGEARLVAAIALAEAGLCAEGLATARKQGTRFLVEELNRQILPDGGHLSRNPGILVDLLLDLLPLRQSYAARGATVPAPLLNAIDRIIPMIRMFRHGDGTLALFNGMGVTAPDVLATVLTYDDVRARPVLNASHSGYQRTESAGTLIIADVGTPPPPGFSGLAGAGTLAFELSVGQHRIIINCGRPSTLHRSTVEAARSTAAHSTLVVADTSSSRLAAPALRRWLGDRVVAGPTRVTLSRNDDRLGHELAASHDGYVSRFGLVHERKIVLRRSGNTLLGEDRLVPAPGSNPAGPRPYAVRFHLHPSVRAQPLAGRPAVLLILPDDDRWLFETQEGAVMVEESVLFAVGQGAQPTLQLVLHGTVPDAATRNWSFARIGGGLGQQEHVTPTDGS